MNRLIVSHCHCVARIQLCLALAIAGIATASHGANLVAHWKLNESGSPYADASTNAIPLVLDTGTASALPAVGSDGRAGVLRWDNPPGTSTRLAATNAALQTDSFGFSFWIKPTFLNQFDNLILKEMAFDNSVEEWRRMAWQVHLVGTNAAGEAPIEFIVRGANRAQGDFYGVVTSTNTLPVQTASSAWVHIAGGYDANTGALTLFVNGSAHYGNGTPGADNSDGSAFAIGTARNGNDFIQFAAGTAIDDVQLYDASIEEVADAQFLMNHPGLALGETPAPTSELIAHWKLDEIGGGSYPDHGPNGIGLVKDAGTTAPGSGVGVDGLCANLLFADPGPSTRLYASNALLQTDSFGFSLWLSPVSLNAGDNVLVKEMALDNVNPDFTKAAWQLHLLGDNGSGFAPMELVVRGDNRAQGDFYGAAVSTAVFPLGTNTATWMHIAGGYDAATGELRLFVDGVAAVSGSSSSGAQNSGGFPLSIGTGKNGPDFKFFAANANVDDVQLYADALSSAEVDYLRANPGVTLPVIPPLRITAFTYNAGSGEAALTFDSISGTNYAVQVSTTLSGFTGATNLTATGASTPVTLSKAQIDGVLGAPPRPQLFVRVKQQ